ncbi:MAG: mitochondrial fission ELM1 family protein [Candidatus Pelagibacter sp.]
MSKLKGLLLTEGMHGMISQVEGLAKALDIDFTHHKVELNSFWKLIPPKFTPISNFTFNSVNTKDFDIIISCGRKSVIPSICLKKNSKKKIYNIHIQDPKVSFKNFDFIIAPEHDGLTGKNVILSKGSIHYLTKEEIVNNREYLSQRLNKEKEYLSLIIGGPNKYYDYNEENIKKVFNKVKNILEKNNLQAIIVPSMRTPKKIIELSANYFDKDNLVFKDIDKKAYLSCLSLAKYIVVTCDSTSMISEAALTGKPIYIAEIPSKKNDYRFRRFRDLFTKLKIVKNLDEKVEIWSYEILDETNRIAKEIKRKIS